MNPRMTGLLALIALALGAFVYLYEIGGDPEREAEKEEAGRVFRGLDASEITAVELTTREGVPARFEMQDGAWRVTKPVEAPADATALDAISHALTHLPRQGEVKSPREPNEYGLAESARIVRFEVEGAAGAERKALRIGRSTPVGGHVYVSTEGEGEGVGEVEVAFVESYRLNAFNRNLADLRERRIFGFEVGAVNRIALNWPHRDGPGQVELTRGEDGLWVMTRPVEARADEETVREVLSNLSFLRAQDFVDERSDALNAALADPLIEIEWTLSAGAPAAVARIAESVEGDLLVDGGGESGPAYRVALERLADFPRTINAYRFKQLASFELVAARRLEFEFAADQAADAAPVRVVAELAEGGWSSADRSLDPDGLSDLVRNLSTLRASEIFADEMGPAELASLGLSPPSSVIRVYGEGDAAPLAVIRFGREDAGRGLFVQNGDDPTIYLLPSDRAEDLPIDLAAFSSGLEVKPEAEEAETDLGLSDDLDDSDDLEDAIQEFEALPGLDSP